MSKTIQRACRAVPVMLAILLGAPGLSNGQSGAVPRANPAAASVPVPFREGERLEYQIGWSNFLTAATAMLLVYEQRAFEGRPAWHFRARASTVGGVRILYELDDQYDSYSDTATLESFQYEEYQRHQKRNEQHIVRVASGTIPAKNNSPATRVPAGTRDPLGVFYALRATDWGNTREMNCKIYNGKTLYDLRARLVVREEMARVPAGNFRASKIEIRLYERGREVTDTRFWLWLAQDERRTPVLMEALLPFGTLRVELKSAVQVTN